MDAVERAKKLREEYERALDAAESRRTAYHEAVLDLHRSGTPLREIAKELGLSHQRVHQMVSGEAPRRSKLPRAVGGIAGSLVLLAATVLALWLANATPFDSHAVKVVPFAPRAVGPPPHSPLKLVVFRGFGGIRRPPGGAVLSKKREVVTRATSVGRASIWVAPDRVAATSHCIWLEIGRAVYGGSCYQPPRRGLPEVVPLVLSIKGRTLPLLWGRVGTNVARLSILFQDGSRAGLPHADGVFLYPVPRSRWNKGHRPTHLIALDKHNRSIDNRPLYRPIRATITP